MHVHEDGAREEAEMNVELPNILFKWSDSLILNLTFISQYNAGQ